MAPMVDRTVVRFPSQVGSAGTRKGTGGRYATWKEHRTHSTIRFACFLSLFKGQGAAVRGDDRVVNVRHGNHPRRAISSAG